jgi:phosphatidylserine/phosphatidylglycerophosphate/cardiolipin synthase-like enzyme
MPYCPTVRSFSVAAAAIALVVAGPAYGGLSLITEPQQGYAPIYALLASPKHTLDLTIYELQDVKAEQILAADAHRGVQVRVLLDRSYIGSYDQRAFSYLQGNGVRVRWASSQVEITHEKSFVIDHSKAVIMTGNLTSQYYSTTRDFAVVDTNAADVSAIEQTFDLDWTNEPGVPPHGSDLVWSPGSEQTLVSLIESAHRSLLVENEEISAPAIVGALEEAASRNVHVRLVMEQSSEWDDTFDALVRAGVQVRTYNASAALYIHAKVIDVDDSRVFIGSENFSVESLQYNRELGLITSSPTIVNAIQQTLTDDFEGGHPWQA